MKYVVAFLLLIVLGGCSSEFQIVEADVPAVVLEAFRAKYVGAGDVIWEVEKDDGRLVYEVNFKKDGKGIEAVFKSDGTFVEEDE